MSCFKIIFISIVLLVAFSAQSKDAFDLHIWTGKIKLFQDFSYKSRSELFSQSKQLLNQIADDDSLSYQQKIFLRRKVNNIEAKISAQLPELRLVGFKKTPIDPQNPKEGYILEPEYR